MANPPTPQQPAPPLDPLAAVLSYLMPGLGQVYQGRVAKGLLFMICLNALFFYGMYLGHWSNVYIPAEDAKGAVRGKGPKGIAASVVDRVHFIGQFWIGIVAWPAVYQYWNYDPAKDAGPLFGKYMRAPKESELNDLQRDGNKHWDLGWVYTVIAGVLNVLVIYDALAGPAFRENPEAKPQQQPEAA
jgi:hypothetical protein